MTSDGYCTIFEFSGMVNRHVDTIYKWIKSGKFTVPEDRKIHRGREVIKANALIDEYNRTVSQIEQGRQEREQKKYQALPGGRPRVESGYNKGAWGKINLEPIKLPKIVHETEMTPYRQLGWAMLIDAVLDMASPCMSDNRNRKKEHQELTTSRATRWLSGESDPEMLSLACQLAGVSERWIKEKVATIKRYPSRTEMKRMLSEWRAHVGMRKQPNDDGSLRCSASITDDGISDLFDRLPRIETVQPIFTRTRQHKNNVAAGF